MRVEGQPGNPGEGYGLALSNGTSSSVLFVFYPFGKTMRSSHYIEGHHQNRVFGDFRAGNSDSFQLTIKIKRNRFEVFVDSVCIKTVPSYIDTTTISAVLLTTDGEGVVLPFKNFRVRSRAPGVPVLPYCVSRRHQKGLLVQSQRHRELGMITKIGKVSGDIKVFCQHLEVALSTPEKKAKVSSLKSVWVVGNHKTKILTWLKYLGF